MVCTKFQAYPGLQGYDGILHGGVIAALLDAAMTHCLFYRGVQAVTGDLRIQFLQPVPCNSLLDLRAKVLSVTPPLYCVKAELVFEQRVMAWAEAKFMQR
jgi:acyl-coenzyme A thioesterase PaaI-like protein